MKYIIELEDEPRKELFADAGNYYRCKQRPFWFISEDTRDSLTPYTESDRKQIEDEVWEFVRIMFQVMDTVDRLECFGNKGMPCLSGHSVLSDMTYQEAKAKYEAWKAEREQIRVGDEVEAESGSKACVLYGNQDWTHVFVFKPDGAAAWWSKCAIHKTGRHFDEVEELLKKMKGEQDG